jgi:hypothetical protein
LGRAESGIEAPHVKFVGTKLADNAQWREECGSCHVAFHPNLLPSRSWSALMTGQAVHFGSDLALDASTSAAILTFLSANSADDHPTEASFKITRLLKETETPLRITETAYWVKKHRNITPHSGSQRQLRARPTVSPATWTPSRALFWMPRCIFPPGRASRQSR